MWYDKNPHYLNSLQKKYIYMKRQNGCDPEKKEKKDKYDENNNKKIKVSSEIFPS